MTSVDMESVRDGLNRLANLFVDEGSVGDINEANARLGEFQVRVLVGPEASVSPNHQAALLTFVNVASRSALGGVSVAGNIDGVRLVNAVSEPTLDAAVVALGGCLEPDWVPCPDDVPTVVIGTAPLQGQRVLRANFEGWRGGIVRRP